MSHKKHRHSTPGQDTDPSTAAPPHAQQETSTGDVTPARQEAPEATPPQGPEETIRRLRLDIEQAKDRYLRTLAEFDNTRKRLQREKDEYAKYAAEAIMRQLVPIVDSLDQALMAVEGESNPSALTKGVQLIARQLAELLEKEGVRRIVAVGEAFDPHRHEAIAHVEGHDGQPENTVVEEVQVGYTMHGKVLRPAMVKIAQPPRKDASTRAEGDGRLTAPDRDAPSGRDGEGREHTPHHTQSNTDA